MILTYPLSYDPGYRSDNQKIATPLPVEAYTLVKAGAVTSGESEPSYAAPSVINGAAVSAQTFHDLWYYRVHLFPAQVSLGNLSGDVQRQIVLWNANFNPVSLSSVVASGDGISYQTDAAVPSMMAPLEYQTYTLLVSGSGASVVEGTITYTVDGVPYVVPISGMRSVLLPFKPNWASGMRETLQWRTSLTTSFSGKEQVKSLRSPRRIFEYALQLLDRREAALYDQLLFGWSARMFTVPIWNEGASLASASPMGSSVLDVDTSFMTLEAGGNLVLYRGAFDYELAQVESFTSDSVVLRNTLGQEWAAGSKIYPMMVGALEPSNANSRNSDWYLSASLRITASPGEVPLKLPIVPATQLYKGDELYTRFDTNWRDVMAGSNEARETRQDNDLGVIRIAPHADYPLRMRSFSWLVSSRAMDLELRAFFARRGGRQYPAWMSSGTDDFVLAAPTIPGSNQLSTAPNQYASLIRQHPAMRHILLVLRDGRRLPYEIVDSTDTDGLTILSLDRNFEEVIAPEQLKRISYLGLYRLGADDVTFDRKTDTVAEVAVNFVLKVPE